MFRVAPYISKSKKQTLMDSFCWSQCSYCPLVWMFRSRTLSSKINCLHERSLGIVYNDKKSTYEHLLVRDRSVSVHVINLQILATKVFKFYRDLSPPIFKELFNKRTLNYELVHPSQSAIPRVESVYYGSKSLACLGPKIWNMVQNELKEMF